MAHSPRPSRRLLPAELPDGGWSRFMAEEWETRPRVFRSIVARPDALSGMLFRAAVAAARSKDARIQRRFLASRPAHKNDPRPLPRRADGGFEAYLARAAAETRSRDVSFIVNDAQGASAALFDTGVEFLSTLCETVGIPMESDCVIFATHARVSALGIHRDPYSNFLFVAEGEKTFLLWPRDAVPGTPNEVPVARIPAMRATAQRVHLKAGDMLYMPSGWYHCGLQDGFSVHLSVIVGAGGEQVTKRFFWRELKQFLENCFDGVGGKDFFANGEAMVPQLPEAITLPLRQSLARTQDAEQLVRSAALRLQSSAGFTVPPPERPQRPLKPADLVSGRPSNLRMMVSGRELLVAACGQVYRVPAHPLLVGMMETLATGETVPVRELLRRFTGTGEVGGEEVFLDRQWVLFFLRNLGGAGWLRIVPPKRRTA